MERCSDEFVTCALTIRDLILTCQRMAMPPEKMPDLFNRPVRLLPMKAGSGDVLAVEVSAWRII
jgi:hypothetical protein